MSEPTRDWSATLAELDELVEQRKYIPVTTAELARERTALERIARQAIAALTLATQRAEAAEAHLNAAYAEFGDNAQFMSKPLSARIAELCSERDALRKDAARLDFLDALLTPESRIEIAHYKCDNNKTRGDFAQIIKLIDIEDREGDDTYGFGPSVRAALDAALAVQSTRCESCDGTGDRVRADGEWLGNCSCKALAVQPTTEGL